jgi:hypothetical protein
MSESTRQPGKLEPPAATAALAAIFVLIIVFLFLYALRPSNQGFGTAPFIEPTTITAAPTPAPAP